MKKVTVMSDSEIHEIAEAYADYDFRPGEKSIFSVFGSRERILRYLEMSIQTALKSDWIYSVGDNREAYIAISYSDSHPPLHIMLSFPFRAMKAVGTRPLICPIPASQERRPFPCRQDEEERREVPERGDAMRKKGVSGERIHAEGYGRSLPICRWEKTSCSPGNR